MADRGFQAGQGFGRWAGLLGHGVLPVLRVRYLFLNTTTQGYVNYYFYSFYESTMACSTLYGGENRSRL
jgi:hypothetical protein